MTSIPVLVCVCVAIVVARPWWVRPRVPGNDSVGAPRTGSPTGLVVAPGALWGAAVVAGFVAHPMVGLAVGAWPTVRRLRRRRRDRIKGDRAVVRALPEVVDLIVLGVGAGLTPRAAAARCEAWLPPPFGRALAEARRRSDAGEPFAAALESSAAVLGDAARPLISVLVAAEHTPGSLVPTLVRVGDEARRRRRVDAQEQARRLPVTMLLPLVMCVLPAFGLLAVAPLLISSLRDLGIGS